MIEAMVESAIRSAELAEATGLAHDRESFFRPRCPVLAAIWWSLPAPAVRGDYALHLA